MPACPKCGRSMVRRTARQGPNTGDEFWGCPAFPRCRGNRPISNEDNAATKPPQPIRERFEDAGSLRQSGMAGLRPSAETRHGAPETGEPAAARSGGRLRVPWRDATLTARRRHGWRARYATVGASLRSIPDARFATLSNCWVARSDHAPSAGPGVCSNASTRLRRPSPGFRNGSRESSVLADVRLTVSWGGSALSRS